MKFFAYGCSYTFGSELADHLTINSSVAKTEKIKRRLGHDKFYGTYGFGDKGKENQLAYPAYIAKTIGLETYENRAYPGSGTLNMFYKILNDINENLITKDDIIFVGLTSFNRFAWFNTTGKLEVGLPTSGIWPSDKFKKQYILHTSDNNWVLNNIAYTRAIIDLCKDYKFFYQTTHWPYTHTYGAEEIYPAILKELENIDENALLPFRGIYYETPNPNKWQDYSHTFGHPFQQYHQSFGKKLGEAILEKL